jgi:hypothetical protein
MKKLINRKTKAIFPYNKGLLKNKDMEPYDDESEFAQAQEQEPSGASSENGIIISRATKSELIKYAMDAHGIQIEDDLTVPQIREQVKKLEEEG